MSKLERLTGLGERIRKLRALRGWSAETLALEAGLSMSMIYALEKGRRPNPRVRTVAAISEALDVSLSELLFNAHDE